MSDPARTVLASIVGQRAWLVKRGHGSFVTLEFGLPHLEIREAVPSSDVRAFRRPLVAVRGDWHLWVYCCTWRIEEAGVVLAHSESTDAEIDVALRAIDGQTLTAVELVPSRGMSRFIFELGTVLETSPPVSDEMNESWLLFEPAGRVLTYRDDGCYDWSKGDEEPDKAVWLPIPPAD